MIDTSCVSGVIASTTPLRLDPAAGRRRQRTSRRRRFASSARATSSTDLCSMRDVTRCTRRPRDRRSTPCSARLFDSVAPDVNTRRSLRRTDARRDCCARRLDERPRAAAGRVLRRRIAELARHALAASPRRRRDRAAPSPRSRDRSRGYSSRRRGWRLLRIERRQRAAQDVELVLLERRLVKDPAQLELHLLLMRGMQELRLREQALEVLVQALELGGRREPPVADRAFRQPADSAPPCAARSRAPARPSRDSAS